MRKQLSKVERHALHLRSICMALLRCICDALSKDTLFALAFSSTPEVVQTGGVPSREKMEQGFAA
jgi:hypothetical protein